MITRRIRLHRRWKSATVPFIRRRISVWQRKTQIHAFRWWAIHKVAPNSSHPDRHFRKTPIRKAAIVRHRNECYRSKTKQANKQSKTLRFRVHLSVIYYLITGELMGFWMCANNDKFRWRSRYVECDLCLILFFLSFFFLKLVYKSIKQIHFFLNIWIWKLEIRLRMSWFHSCIPYLWFSDLKTTRKSQAKHLAFTERHLFGRICSFFDFFLINFCLWQIKISFTIANTIFSGNTFFRMKSYNCINIFNISHNF